MPPPAHPEAAISRISPKPPRTCRTGIASTCPSPASAQLSSLAPPWHERLFSRTSRRTGHTGNIDAQGVTRAAMSRAHRRGASVAGLSPRGADA